MLRSVLQPFSTNFVQLLVNQCSSLGTFLLLARELPKDAFGPLNGMLGLLLLVFGVLSFGIDQLLVRQAAAGEETTPLLRAALFHNALGGGAFCALLLLMPHFWGAPALLLLAFGKMALYLAAPLKSITNGREQFRRLLAMSVFANLVKLIGCILLATTGRLNLAHVIPLFAAGDALEAIACTVLFRGRAGGRTAPVLPAYRSLLRAAMPQLGTVAFAAALSRLDWLLLGALRSPAELAEYSFAYKAFETAQLPLLALAPILLPRFTKMAAGGIPDPGLRRLRQTELLIAAATLLALNLFWTPLAGAISGGKYGESCRWTVFWLSLALPVLYYNNYLWSLHFAWRRTAFIFRNFALTVAVNALANLWWIPLFGKEGAAAAFATALLVQTTGYHLRADRRWRFRLRVAEAT